MYHTLDLEFQNHQNAIACFCIESNSGLILIESGPFSTYQNLERALNKIGFSTDDVHHVLLTHIHFDHAGAAWAFAEMGANIYVHPLGAPHMLNPERLVASATQIYGDRMDALWGQMKGIEEENLRIVEHMEVLNIDGKTFTALHTPGHAKHHIAWQHKDVIFTGDVAGVQIGKGPVVPPCPPPDINIEDWKDSIVQILKRNPKRLVLTHFGEVDRVALHLESFLEILDDWSTWIKEKWETGLKHQQITPQFVKYTTNQLRNRGVSEIGIEQYEAANPSWMSVAGLIRYWEKRSR
ncbi:MAG: MBL fold metallo-hydrolase [Bacteroidota bacterium]